MLSEDFIVHTVHQIKVSLISRSWLLKCVLFTLHYHLYLQIWRLKSWVHYIYHDTKHRSCLFTNKNLQTLRLSENVFHYFQAFIEKTINWSFETIITGWSPYMFYNRVHFINNFKIWINDGMNIHYWMEPYSALLFLKSSQLCWIASWCLITNIVFQSLSYA